MPLIFKIFYDVDGSSEDEYDEFARFNVYEDVGNVFKHIVQRQKYPYPEDNKQWTQPQCLIIFSERHISTLAKVIVNTLHNAFGHSKISSVLIHESLRQEMINKLRMHMTELMDPAALNHPNFLNTLNLLKQLKPETIHMLEYDKSDVYKRWGYMKEGSPIVVMDFPQYYFGTKPSGIITLNTFRSLNDVVALVKREGLKFNTISSWSDKMAENVELLSRLSFPTRFFFNCINLDLDEILRHFEKTQAKVVVKGNYHYELITTGGSNKLVVHPVQNVFQP